MSLDWYFLLDPPYAFAPIDVPLDSSVFLWCECSQRMLTKEVIESYLHFAKFTNWNGLEGWIGIKWNPESQRPGRFVARSGTFLYYSSHEGVQ